MPRLILTVGLPRSGKSTWARSTGWPIVNPDSIRLVLSRVERAAYYSGGHNRQWEPHVWRFADQMVQALFTAGHEEVILDATNLRLSDRQKWYRPEWAIQLVCFPCTPEEAEARAIASDQANLIPVIRRMNANAEWPAWANRIER